MKFIFKNLGPIHEAELELGDLTIIAGRNNTGKTYVAYTLYGFLVPWQGWPQFPEFFHNALQKYLSFDKSLNIPTMEKLAKAVLQEGQVKWAVDREELSRARKTFLREMALGFSAGALPQVFSAPPEDFEGTSLEVSVEETFFEDTPSPTFRLPTGDTFTITYSDNEVCTRRVKMGEEVPPTDVVTFLLSDLYLTFFLPKLPSPFILSAERFGISLFYKELDFTKNRLVEVLQEMGKDRDRDRFLPFSMVDKMTGRYAIPIRDNIGYTRILPELQKRRSEIYDSKLFDDIRDMMGGYYKSSGDDIRFKSKARKERRFDIPLHLASSSARGLSDLYFFLRHVAEKNQLLIIDEPESHLDTANQIQFARLLAQAVHAGLKVLITTHSDYIVKEINNLLMLSQEFKDKSKVLKKLKYSEHDYLKPESVRAYVAENNSLTRCTIEKYGIDMPVFDTTIHDINKVSNELGFRLKHEGEK